jgi:hypothetical protein
MHYIKRLAEFASYDIWLVSIVVYELRVCMMLCIYMYETVDIDGKRGRRLYNPADDQRTHDCHWRLSLLCRFNGSVPQAKPHNRMRLSRLRNSHRQVYQVRATYIHAVQ